MAVLRSTLPQDAASGRAGSTINGIAELARFTALTRWDAAVAYASRAGCERLDALLAGEVPTWNGARKRWLVSMDFGRTDPEALRFLAGLGRSEVRVPDGRYVAASPGFAPRSVFHPKVYICRGRSDEGFGLIVGSGNLTISGLAVGTECATLSAWRGRLDASERAVLDDARSALDWFDALWEAADPLADVLDEYEATWRRHPTLLAEDETPPARRYLDTEPTVVARDLAANYAAARALWVEAGTLSRNRGEDEAGNQLDLKRGARVFFGFPARDVAKNTVFGQVLIECAGFDAQECSVRFGNNYMDKVNLPVPGKDGPDSYDDYVLIFERAQTRAGGLPLFRLTVTDEAGVANRRAHARAELAVPLRSGRGMGLLF